MSENNRTCGNNNVDIQKLTIFHDFRHFPNFPFRFRPGPGPDLGQGQTRARAGPGPGLDQTWARAEPGPGPGRPGPSREPSRARVT